MKTSFLSFCVLLFCFSFTGKAQTGNEPTTREMNLINWMEFRDFIPSQIETVLLPVGTLEPHGVIPNGADNLAPEAMAKELASGVNAMIAPTLNYGVTGGMKAFPGAFEISEAAYRLFVTDIIRGLAKNKFINIIILNGHGGPQTAILQDLAGQLSEEERVRLLVVNWWSLASEDTFDVFGENGGHAGNNETAYVQAIVPEHIHANRYEENMATAYPSGTAWAAYPFPSSIGLYEKGQGYPTFDTDQAQEYYRKVNKRVENLIQEVIKKWDLAGLYRN
ncbi:MAG TPA: creatininase family protein [Halalkalibaculum sp.]|nr:creatininase family protein [Halalkalibaculum sp.]